MRRRWLCVATVLGMLLAAPASEAATFTVNTTADAAGPCPTPTTCTLRQAIAGADAAPGDDTVDFDLPAGSVIGLTVGPLEITGVTAGVIRIIGPGASALTVRPDASVAGFPVLQLLGFDVVVTGLTISGGVAGPFDGPAISAFAPLLLDRVVITGNTSDAGGPGGGSSGALVVGGGATIRNSAVYGNSVTNSGGGASAGAIINLSSVLVVNSTFTGNRVTGPGPGDAGAINNLGGSTTLFSSTIAGNSAEGGAGGVSNDGLAMANSILAGNSASPSPDCQATPVSRGYNLVGDPTGCTFAAAVAGDQVGTATTPLNPLFGPFANNGGPTPTLALAAGSPARDAGSPAPVSDAPATTELVPCTATDQRGVARPQGLRCDVGAFEVAVPPPVVPPPVVPPPVVPAPVVPAPVAPAPAPPPFVAPPVDHVKCYSATQPGFRPRDVRLRDQFARTARRARARRATLLCNPARKNGSPVREPRAHLVCYQTRDAGSFTARRVSVTNQFGTRTLRVVRPVSLCVPSLKRRGTRAPGTSPNPERRLDHFRCYDVAPSETPRLVTLADQFLTTRSAIVSVMRLCNPVSKNGGAIRRPAAHLVCYLIRDVAEDKVRRATVRNQFGVARLRVTRARSLCVPSLKRDLASVRAVVRGWSSPR